MISPHILQPNLHKTKGRIGRYYLSSCVFQPFVSTPIDSGLSRQRRAMRNGSSEPSSNVKHTLFVAQPYSLMIQTPRSDRFHP